MLLEFDTQCPAFDCWTVGIRDTQDGKLYQCEHCDGCRGIFANGIDCGYSRTPIGEPRFVVGQVVYRNGFIKGEALTVVSCCWDGRFQWQYLLRSNISTRRERHYTPEKILFATREESDMADIQMRAKSLLKQIEGYEKRYGKRIGSLNIKEISG